MSRSRVIVALFFAACVTFYLCQVHSSTGQSSARRNIRSILNDPPEEFRERIRDRRISYEGAVPSSHPRSYFDQWTRNSSTHETVTEWQRRKTGLNGGRDQLHPHSKSATTSHQVSNGFGPIRVTDNEIPGNVPSVVHRRYNVTTSTSSSSGSSSAGHTVTGPRVPNQPVLWFNRTWHWSTNRTREYDPDLDGTTLPSVDEWDIPIPPPLIEPYETQFPWELTSCDERSCHPGTGNLLIGREANLTATSTCGLRGPEGYCVISGVNQQRKKCFVCDTKSEYRDDRLKYHGIENIVPTYGMKRKGFWWQAENGVEKVSIQLNLGNEFHFTHLMIVFQTFRPAAMIIERSKDLGKTWEVYQYFAHNCKEVFPHVSRKERRNLTDVVCTQKYSSDDHASFGEVIFRVLPPSIRIDNPYDPEVQNLLKVTNLRLNFTKLHTLGDNLLDGRPEIREKYYYAIHKMIVRGKCSCYGHASRCVPEPGQPIVPDMVYGHCQCQHFTTGANCENCLDLYNDLEWKPAVGDEINACKKCNCNNHATSCHFDKTVFEDSGRISGGVCDDCQHNTQGKNCEMCRPYFYRDTSKPPDDPNVCLPCDCDPSGSHDDALCDSMDDAVSGEVAGKCHCKQNVEGRRCDRCKHGYWNFSAENYLGCEPCSCNQLGTVGNLGCDFKTGECVCKRNVEGRDCNKCVPEFWGLGSEEEGCKPCDCDEGGAYNNSCNVISGQCPCRPHVTGRRCDQPESLYFTPYVDHLLFEGERAKASPDTQIIEREPYPNSERSWTGTGFVRVLDKSYIEFDIAEVPTTMLYDLYIRYEPQSRSSKGDSAKVTLDRIAGSPSGICRENPGSDEKTITFSPTERMTKAESGSFCLERLVPYRVRVEMESAYDPSRDGTPSTLIDSIILVPKVNEVTFFKGTPANERKLIEFESNRCVSYALPVSKRPLNEVCKKYLNSLGLYEFDGAQECSCDSTGSSSALCDPLGGQCKCKPNVIGRRCNRCAPGFYGFGPDGCKPCDCHHVGSVDNFCDLQSGQCTCRANTYGRQCDECQPGFWNYPNCQRCDCNGHSDICDSKTGVCINCRDHTSGPKCEVCEKGFYGNPLVDYNIQCRPCPCPGVPGSGVSHADTCDLDPRTQNPICRCLPGYTGERCDRCDHNYYGSPTVINGVCQQCDCNNNTDLAQPGNCDPRSGECLKCLYETSGRNCEICRPGFFGDATKQQCSMCVCNEIGTNLTQDGQAVCNQYTGQCPCLPNVVGKECNECAPSHWNLASGKGCQACECDTSGSYSLKCNLFDGQCHCKPGHGGRQCNECQENFWGNPKVECFPCDCSTTGSSSTQCDRQNGSCICKEGIAGDKCDKCARGFIGRAPNCERCGECFENWDVTISELKRRTDRLVEDARRIKTKGTTGAYKGEFQEIENRLLEIEKIISGANVTQTDVAGMEQLINALRGDLNKIQDSLNQLNNRMEETSGRTTDSILQLSHLKNAAKSLEIETQNIKENMTALQEANVEGAFNLTRDAQIRSANANHKVQATMTIVSSSATKRTDTEDMLNKYSSTYNASYLTNEESLKTLGRKIKQLEDNVPTINNLVCDGRAGVNDCDALCGGAGCGKCGGISCKGAATLASDALTLATKSKDALNEKQEKARKELDGILSAKIKSDEALKQASLAYEKSLTAKNNSYETTTSLQQLLDDIDRFFAAESSRPAEIRTISEQCMALKMSLTPDQILDLAKQINETMSGITNIESILVATASDLQTANDLKRQADIAKARADEILNASRQVLDALERARQAQEKAQSAIRKATSDIENANVDLVQIKGESDSAYNLSSKAQEEANALKDRLENLKKNFTQNELDVKKASDEADNAGKLSEEAARNASDLENKYSAAKNALEQKTRDSGANKQRAEKLRDRAKALAEATTIKYRELQGLGDEFDENERRLKAYLRTVDESNNAMRGHLAVIEARAEYHRMCVP